MFWQTKLMLCLMQGGKGRRCSRKQDRWCCFVPWAGVKKVCGGGRVTAGWFVYFFASARCPAVGFLRMSATQQSLV